MIDILEDLTDVDVDAIAPSRGIPDPVPPGDYTLALKSAEKKLTSTQTGMYLSCQFEILDPEYAGQLVFNNYNIRNPNFEAQKIGLADFKALCEACAMEFADVGRDVTMLYGVPFLAKLKLTGPRTGKDGKEYGPRNEIARHYAANNAPVTQAAAPAPAAKPAAAPAAKAAPAARAAPAWMKKTGS